MNIKSIYEKLKNKLNGFSKREIILIAVIAVLIILIIIIVVFATLFLNKSLKTETPPASSALPSSGQLGIIGINKNSSSGQPTTFQPLTEKITVPDVNSPASNLANPNSIIPFGTAKSRSFSITISNNQFTPNQIAAYQGDNLAISFTAKDKNYDVYQPEYGWKQTILKGESKPVIFQATASGKFTFYCQSCGGPSKGPVGYIYVSPIK
jgi:heme/copper-type cytochrome/quinol oxidase subunit 2